MKKYIWVILLSICVCFVGIIPLLSYDNKNIFFSVIVESGDRKETIEAWKDSQSGKYYFFLPAYAEAGNTKIHADNGMSIAVEDNDVADGESVFERFELEKEYSVKSKGLFGQSNIVLFVKAQDVATLYVRTSTGSMKEVFNDKSHEESAVVTVYSKDGVMDSCESSVTINGRGNSTWDEEKKPFTLKYSDGESLLGMQESSKWILLANGRDKTNLKNKIIFDLAKNEGLQYTPESEYVMLYLNGEYYGLFLLCQSINTIAERADSNESDLRVCKFEFNDRLLTLKNGELVGKRRIFIEKTFPKKLSDEENNQLLQKVEKTDDAIVMGIDGGKDLSDYIDIESWVKRYVIDEAFENYDAGIASSYFYWFENSEDDKVYAGPLWDYDNCAGGPSGAIKNPAIIFASHDSRSEDQVRYWYPELLKNDSFYNSVIDYYKNSFSKTMELMINDSIPYLKRSIASAVMCDEKRWNYKSETIYEKLIDYLSVRKDFLDSYWIAKEPFCVVRYQIEGEHDYKYEYIPYGKTLYDSAYVDSAFENPDYAAYTCESGEKVDLSKPIYEDLNLDLKKKNSGDMSTIQRIISEFGGKRDLMVPITIVLMVLVSVGLFIRERNEGA